MSPHRIPHVVTVLALGLVFAGSPALAEVTDDWGTVPPEVLTSLGADGWAASEAIGLSDGVSGNDDATASYTHGPPLRLLIWGPWEGSVRPVAAAEDRLTERDLSARVGRRWLAVQYVDGRPVSTLEVDEQGRFVALGGYRESDAVALASAAPGTVVLGASLLGGPDELYAVSDDRRRLTPLNAAAAASLGRDSIGIAEFRDLKTERRLDDLADAPRGLPPDEVGAAALDLTAAPGAEDSGARPWPGVPPAVAVALSALGPIMMGWGLLLLRRPQDPDRVVG